MADLRAAPGFAHRFSRCRGGEGGRRARGLPTAQARRFEKARCRRCAGFTLLELLIGIAVLSILTSVALPSYREYMRRGQLSAAFENLGMYRMRLEQAYQDGGNYGLTSCAVTTPAATAYFQYSCALTDSGQGYTATATGLGMMAGFAYTTDAGGNNRTIAFPGGTGLPAACWWLRAGDC